MIRRVLIRTNGECIGFIDDQNLRYTIGVSQQGRLEELAGETSLPLAIIDYEHGFDSKTAMKATTIEPDGVGARVYVEGWPSALVLTRAELATLAYVMRSRELSNSQSAVRRRP